ncbi:unannotated protein [freshwater metagenome]|uniref:Unannotated protein n=1 Tax=freshwater metagenome TaxID=449393 RepID=A0A6J6PEY4_9ZZZZ
MDGAGSAPRASRQRSPRPGLPRWPLRCEQHARGRLPDVAGHGRGRPRRRSWSVRRHAGDLGRLPLGLQHRRRGGRPRADPRPGLGPADGPAGRDPGRRHRLPVRRHRLRRVQRAPLRRLRGPAAGRHRSGPARRGAAPGQAGLPRDDPGAQRDPPEGARGGDAVRASDAGHRHARRAHRRARTGPGRSRPGGHRPRRPARSGRGLRRHRSQHDHRHQALPRRGRRRRPVHLPDRAGRRRHQPGSAGAAAGVARRHGRGQGAARCGVLGRRLRRPSRHRAAHGRARDRAGRGAHAVPLAGVLPRPPHDDQPARCGDRGRQHAAARDPGPAPLRLGDHEHAAGLRRPGRQAVLQQQHADLCRRQPAEPGRAAEHLGRHLDG